ncbi:MAG: sigma-70 family RNA polymerase sigma factor [Verrucomicrobiota bacterium]
MENDDKKALDIYTAQRSALVDYAKSFLGAGGQSEDVVQEAWLRFSRANAEKSIDEPVSYLFRIVRNLSLNQYQKQKRDPALVDFRDAVGQFSTLEKGPDPRETATARDDLEQVQRILEQLPERVRIALEMKRFGGFKLREIALRLGVSVTTAHELIAEGLAACRKGLKERK